jgi:hypothetical protein
MGNVHKLADYIYVGVRKSDGSIRATSWDDEGCENEIAATLSDWIRRGLAVERLTDDEYRARMKPAPRTPEGLSKADQTPGVVKVVRSTGGDTMVVVPFDDAPDNVKTRIVRKGGEG